MTNFTTLSAQFIRAKAASSEGGSTVTAGELETLLKAYPDAASQQLLQQLSRETEFVHSIKPLAPANSQRPLPNSSCGGLFGPVQYFINKITGDPAQIISENFGLDFPSEEFQTFLRDKVGAFPGAPAGGLYQVESLKKFYENFLSFYEKPNTKESFKEAFVAYQRTLLTTRDDTHVIFSNSFKGFVNSLINDYGFDPFDSLMKMESAITFAKYPAMLDLIHEPSSMALAQTVKLLFNYSSGETFDGYQLAELKKVDSQDILDAVETRKKLVQKFGDDVLPLKGITGVVKFIDLCRNKQLVAEMLNKTGKFDIALRLLRLSGFPVVINDEMNAEVLLEFSKNFDGTDNDLMALKNRGLHPLDIQKFIEGLSWSTFLKYFQKPEINDNFQFLTYKTIEGLEYIPNIRRTISAIRLELHPNKDLIKSCLANSQIKNDRLTAFESLVTLNENQLKWVELIYNNFVELTPLGVSEEPSFRETLNFLNTPFTESMAKEVTQIYQLLKRTLDLGKGTSLSFFIGTIKDEQVRKGILSPQFEKRMEQLSEQMDIPSLYEIPLLTKMSDAEFENLISITKKLGPILRRYQDTSGLVRPMELISLNSIKLPDEKLLIDELTSPSGQALLEKIIGSKIFRSLSVNDLSVLFSIKNLDEKFEVIRQIFSMATQDPQSSLSYLKLLRLILTTPALESTLLNPDFGAFLQHVKKTYYPYKKISLQDLIGLARFYTKPRSSSPQQLISSPEFLNAFRLTEKMTGAANVSGSTFLMIEQLASHLDEKAIEEVVHIMGRNPSIRELMFFNEVGQSPRLKERLRDREALVFAVKDLYERKPAKNRTKLRFEPNESYTERPDPEKLDSVVLLMIILLNENMESAQTKSRLGELVHTDMNDKVTEHGGAVLITGERFEFREVPSTSINDGAYSNELASQMDSPGIIQYHLHALEEDDGIYAGPSGNPYDKNTPGDWGSAAASGQFGLVMTTHGHPSDEKQDSLLLNADLYFYDQQEKPFCIDLGSYEIPYKQ